MTGTTAAETGNVNGAIIKYNQADSSNEDVATEDFHKFEDVCLLPLASEVGILDAHFSKVVNIEVAWIPQLKFLSYMLVTRIGSIIGMIATCLK